MRFMPAKKTVSKKAVKKKEVRPTIPDHTKLELWAKSGGRCAFKGCNKAVWHDGLTMRALNQSNIAHIVSWTPTGPRGDKVRSKKLAKDISNLMLTCTEHNKLIDTKRFEDQYPEKLLLEYKKEHEERIRLVTEINAEHKTEILLFKANIGDNVVDIDPKQAMEAVLPYYPTKNNPLCIDLTTLANTDRYIKDGLAQIPARVSQLLDRHFSNIEFKHISVFALAPIPFLIQFGCSLGNTIPMRLYQKHRDTDDWKWKSRMPNGFKFQMRTWKSKASTSDVALVFSLSGKVQRDEYRSYLNDHWEIKEISIDNPNPGFLRKEKQVTDFRALYRQVLSNIRSKHGADVRVHIFPAVPAPIAVEIGRSLLPKVDPDIFLYDKQKTVSDQFILAGQLR